MSSRTTAKPADLIGAVNTRSVDLRLALRPKEAAQALGVSDETFVKHIRPSLAVVRVGELRLYPVADLERWLRDRASAPIDEVER